MKNTHDRWCTLLWLSSFLILLGAGVSILTLHFGLAFVLLVFSVVPIVVDRQLWYMR